MAYAVAGGPKDMAYTSFVELKLPRLREALKNGRACEKQVCAVLTAEAASLALESLCLPQDVKAKAEDVNFRGIELAVMMRRFASGEALAKPDLDRFNRIMEADVKGIRDSDDRVLLLDDLRELTPMVLEAANRLNRRHLRRVVGDEAFEQYVNASRDYGRLLLQLVRTP
jgi:hypothetical protein